MTTSSSNNVAASLNHLGSFDVETERIREATITLIGEDAVFLSKEEVDLWAYEARQTILILLDRIESFKSAVDGLNLTIPNPR